MSVHAKPGIGVLSAALLVGVTAALAQEAVQSGQAVSLTQRAVVIYNVSGTVTLRHGTGGAITITATRQGAEGDQLQFQTDTEGSRGRFRVVYPDVERIASPDGRGYGTTDLDLRRDGTFGGDNDGGWRHRGDRTQVGGSRGFRGWANLEVSVPDGRELVVHLVVGHVSADGVNGDVTVDTWSADAEGSSLAGAWLFDTGSGDVVVRGMRGTLKIDTGSGTGTVSNMTGDLLDIDTGSGGAEATNVQVERFRFDTGSGNVRARGITARRGLVDTGSGSVDLVYAGGTIEQLSIDTGSGRVGLTLPPEADARLVIDTGSGDAVLQRAGGIFERRDSDGTVIRFGEGRGRVSIDTGSGGVTIR
jgi:hypothetical protein